MHQARQAQDIGEKGTNLTTHHLYEKFTPLSSLLSSQGRARYVICVTWDGVLFVDAEEDVYVDKNDRHSYHSQLKLNWNVGDLEKKTELT